MAKSRRSVHPLALAGCLAALVLFHGMGTGLPLVDRDEPRFAEAAREMLERRDFVVPFFNDAPRLQKPPLTYWCQVFCYAAFGESERSARLPSVVGASLSALVVFGLGSSLWGARVGFWAAVVFSLSLHTLILAKSATADMLMVLCVTLASWAGWEISRSDATARRSLWWLAFHGSLALGFLAKGPVAWLPLLMLAPRRRPRLLAGVSLLLLLVALWAAPAFVRTDGESLRVGIGQQVIGRSLEVIDGHGAEGALFYVLTLPYYLATVFPSFFPWSIFLPAAAVHLARRDRWTAEERYLLSGIFVVFLAFSLARTKLPHYVYPAFPFLSILFARYWLEEGGSTRRLQVASVGVVLVSVFLFAVLAPQLSPHLPSEGLLGRSRHLLAPEMEFASAGYEEPSLVWSFRKVVRGFHHPLAVAELPAFMERDGGRFCILPAGELAAIEPAMNPRWQRVGYQGVDVAKGRRVDLVMLVKPD